MTLPQMCQLCQTIHVGTHCTPSKGVVCPWCKRHVVMRKNHKDALCVGGLHNVSHTAPPVGPVNVTQPPHVRPPVAPVNVIQAAAPPPRPSGPDPSQLAVILSPLEARLVVEAGPGYGKTYVACGRVAHLIEQGVAGANILLVSFTRTAVREMRNRIRTMAAEGVQAWDVDIRTLDSFAWRLRAGFGETAPTLQGTFEDSVAHAADLLKSPPDAVRDYLQSFKHVLIDEAQDLVGSRALLMNGLLQLLSPDAGYTVFLDPAQAIYDWSEDGGQGAPKVTFADLLKKQKPPPRSLRLEVLHRTSNHELVQFLTQTRHIVLDASTHKVAQMRDMLKKRANGQKLGYDELPAYVTREPAKDELLILFRTRAQCLNASSYLFGQNVTHRLRFGGLPRLAAPWISVVLNSAFHHKGDLVVTRDDVETAWRGLRPSLKAGWDLDRVWRILRKMGPVKGLKSCIDISKIADRLAAAVLPDEVFLKEVGAGGPILGTIHGSKGRESSIVLQALTPGHPDEDDGEARVLYVGLSRAVKQHSVYAFPDITGRTLEQRRVWRGTKSGGTQVQIGCEGDLDPVASIRAAWKSVPEQQTRLETFERTEAVNAYVRSINGHAFMHVGPMQPTGQVPLGALSHGCLSDLRTISRERDHGGALPKTVHPLQWIDVTSVAVHRENIDLGEVPDPWRSTRMWLVPVVVGLGMMKW